MAERGCGGSRRVCRRGKRGCDGDCYLCVPCPGCPDCTPPEVERWTIWKYGDQSGVIGPDTDPPDLTPPGEAWLQADAAAAAAAVAHDKEEG